MLRRIAFLLLALCSLSAVSGQTDSTHLRISLLTCGPGEEEIYEVFGHTGIRIIDSLHHTDEVYNYGTFEYGPNFEMQFMRGKLLYCLSIEPFNGFMQEYIAAKRKVEEQVLLLSGPQKENVYSFLEWNAEPANKYYKYDFFFDNCATRIRDIFPGPDVFGKDFHYGMALPEGEKLTFRDIINQYFYANHWTRFGVNILLGSRIDKVMTNMDIMFLPDYLRNGLDGAAVNGQKIAMPVSVMLPGSPPVQAGINGPFILTCIIAILTMAGLTVRRLKALGNAMSALLLLVTGLLGCLILVMWFGTDHQGCGNNFNILWCLPTNIIIAFFNPKGKGKYALIAIALMFVSFALHLLKIQGLTLFESGPLFVALLFVYGTIYRRSQLKTAP